MTRRPKPRRYHRIPVTRSTAGFSATADPSTAAHAEVTFPARTGPKPRAGVTSSETLRFRCSPGERAEIEAACCAVGRDLSDVVRDLLLAWARRQVR